MSVNVVTVVCDNPKHARGKTCVIAVYRRFPTGWERDYSGRPAAARTRRNANSRRQKKAAAAAAVGNAAQILESLSEPTRQHCNLCGAGYAVGNLKLQMELERVAEHGQSQVTVSQLSTLG